MHSGQFDLTKDCVAVLCLLRFHTLVFHESLSFHYDKFSLSTQNVENIMVGNVF